MANKAFVPVWTRILAAILLIISGGYGGFFGLLLYLIGIATTALYLFATWRVILLFTSMVVSGGKPLPTMVSFFVALGFKIPIFVLLGLWVRNLDFRFQACFLLGLTMVYSWLVGWSLYRQQSNPETQIYGSDSADHNPSIKS